MCERCESKAESMRDVVDALLTAERAARPIHCNQTNGWNAIRLSNTIIDIHCHNGGLSQDDVNAIVIEYAIVVQRLLSLEEMTGMSPPS